MENVYTSPYYFPLFSRLRQQNIQNDWLRIGLIL